MVDKYLIAIKFKYKTKNGTEVYGQMQVPFFHGKIYKPIKAFVNRGYMDVKHRDNKGISSESLRETKEILIKNNTDRTFQVDVVKIRDPFPIRPDRKSIGFMTIMSSISGYNTNREGRLEIIDINKKFNGKILPKLFQNPQKIPVESPELTEIISLSEAYEKNKPYFDLLLSNEEWNSDSCSTIEVENE